MARLFEIIFESKQSSVRIQFTANWFTFMKKKLARKTPLN